MSVWLDTKQVKGEFGLLWKNVAILESKCALFLDVVCSRVCILKFIMAGVKSNHPTRRP
jgi:hypothetical protein